MAADALQLDREQIRKGIKSLPALPAVTTSLLRSIDDENSGVDTLARIIGQDQGLTLRLLRLANSSFFGFSGKIVTIRDATVIIGMRGVRSLALAAALSAAFPKKQGGFDYAAFWEHSMACAVAAQALAKRFGVSPEEGFLCGLLHDFGRLVVVTCFPLHHAAVSAYRKDSDCLPCAAEAAVLGMSHSEIGALLAQTWHFPPRFVQAIAQHHAPGTTADDRLAQTVHLANALAHALDLCATADAAVPPIDRDCWQQAGLDDDGLDELLTLIARQFATMRDLVKEQA